MKRCTNLRSRWRLLLETRNRCVEARPTWRHCRPDHNCWSGDFRTIERPGANNDGVRPHLGTTCEMRSTTGTKSSMHRVTAIGDAAIVMQLTIDDKGVRRKAGIDRAASAAKILAKTAPALACHYGRRRTPIPNRTTKASTGNVHFLPYIFPIWLATPRNFPEKPEILGLTSNFTSTQSASS